MVKLFIPAFIATACASLLPLQSAIASEACEAANEPTPAKLERNGKSVGNGTFFPDSKVAITASHVVVEAKKQDWHKLGSNKIVSEKYRILGKNNCLFGTASKAIVNIGGQDQSIIYESKQDLKAILSSKWLDNLPKTKYRAILSAYQSQTLSLYTFRDNRFGVGNWRDNSLPLGLFVGGNAGRISFSSTNTSIEFAPTTQAIGLNYTVASIPFYYAESGTGDILKDLKQGLLVAKLKHGSYPLPTAGMSGSGVWNNDSVTGVVTSASLIKVNPKSVENWLSFTNTWAMYQAFGDTYLPNNTLEEFVPTYSRINLIFFNKKDVGQAVKSAILVESLKK